jgi:hypothetical protein
MKVLTSIAAFVIIALTRVGGDQRKNWRGIVPLHSTRVDVERLLGQPPPPPADGSWLYTPNPNIPLYFLADENVRIGYMTSELAARMRCSAIPVDTVIWIEVSLKKHPPLRDLGIDESKFLISDPSNPPNMGFTAYVDLAPGIYICTADGEVNTLGYYGDATDRQVCPELNRDPKQFCTILIDFSNKKERPKKAKDD